MSDLGGMKIGVLRVMFDRVNDDGLLVQGFNSVVTMDYIESLGITEDDLYYFVDRLETMFPDVETLDRFVVDSGLVKDAGHIQGVVTLMLKSRGLWGIVDYAENAWGNPDHTDLYLTVFHDKGM